MKRTCLALLLILALLSLSACGGSGGVFGGIDSASEAVAAPNQNASLADSGGGASYGAVYNDFALSDPGDAPESQMDDMTAPSAETRLENAKMIYSARLEVETMDFQTCAASLEQLTASLGGYLESAVINSYNSGYRNGYYTVRVPAAQYQPFLNAMGEIGHVVYQEKESENISETYYDTESRLTTQRTKLERLQALLAQAENMEDLITIESAIAETELDIEHLAGTLRHYDALVDFATINVSLSEVTRLRTVEETPPGFTSRLATAFTGGLHSFSDFVQNFAVALAYGWIWILILAAVIVLVVRRLRKQSAPYSFRQEKPKTENPHDKLP